MTVIVAVLSKCCCVIASDSMITDSETKDSKERQKRRDNPRDKSDLFEKSKIIAFSNNKFYGIMAYWGLAKLYDVNGRELFSTYQWLTSMKKESMNFQNPEDFVIHITGELNAIVNKKFNITKEKEKGIGIQLCVYEDIDGHKVPEMFVIRNFDGIDYEKINPEVEYFRSTYDDMQLRTENYFPEIENKRQRENEYRNLVRDYLNKDKIFIFHNGDTISTNVVYNALWILQDVAMSQKSFQFPSEPKTFCKLAEWGIITVSNFQRDFLKPEYRKVGGKPHSVSVSRNGEIYSDSEKIKPR